MKYFPFLFIFFVCQVQAQEDPVLELSKKRYAEELQASKKKLIQSYDQAIQRAMTAGKLDLANALNAEKKGVDDGKEVVANEPKKVEANPEPKKVVLRKPEEIAKILDGKWITADGKEWWLFDAKGHVRSSFTEGALKGYEIQEDNTIKSYSKAYSKMLGNAIFTIIDNKTMQREIDSTSVKLTKK